jgi:hypothetical protein
MVVGEYPANRRSFSVFCDDSMNKYSHLFTPMIRIATWRREAEITNGGKWPLVDVRWAYLRRGRGRVDQHIRDLIRALGRLKLGNGGLYDRRQSTSAVEGSTLADYSLMVRADVHQIKISGTALRGDALPRLIIDGCELLEAVAKPEAFRGWTECYDQDLSAETLVARSHWKWIPKRESNHGLQPTAARPKARPPRLKPRR